MDNELDLTAAEELLAAASNNATELDLQELSISNEIASLRLKLARLKDTKYQVKQEIKKATVARDSAKRKFELEQKTYEIQQQIESKKIAAAYNFTTAAWFDPTYTEKDKAFKWQVDGALQLPERALLGDKRGMGKTLSSLIWRRVHGIKRLLICVRNEVAYDFIKEISIREPGLFVYRLLGATSEERNMAADLLNYHEEFVVITNIESWRKNIDKTTDELMKIDYDGVILDEAHHIKNANSATAQGFFRIADRIPKVLELTGTPIKNSPIEMYSLLHALYPDLFERESKFKVDYCYQTSQNKWVFTERGLKSLFAKIQPFYLGRDREDVGMDVPPPNIIKYELDFENHELQKEAYKSMTERNLAILGSGKVIPIVNQLAIMIRQAQVVSWPEGIVFKVKDDEGSPVEEIRFDVAQSVKMDWAEDLIQDLVNEDERVVLFSRFKPALYELRKRLKQQGVSVALITGDDKHNTKEIFDDFDLKTASPTNYKYKVLLATYQTVGESANLNAARHAILYDRFWNPGNEDQAIGRIDRINSVDQATVHIPEVKDSIDVFMAELIDDKREIVTNFKSATNMQSSLTEHLKRTV
jgi:SWI/SNF-related matrix-associated actin-dependent regulator of chromatin subfamily A member 5